MVFFTPPWALIPLIPFALLLPFAGLAGLALVSLFSLLFVSRHMLYGNVEWLPLLGLLAPPPLAMLLYATKPQASAGLTALLLIAQWKAARWRGLLITLAPTIVLGVLSVIIWGLPPVPGPNNPGQHSLFPFSLLFGLPALYLALNEE